MGDLNKPIINILELVDKLKSIDENINDAHISAILLCSLPPLYDNLKISLESRPEQELNPKFIRSRLIDEYTRR